MLDKVQLLENNPHLALDTKGNLSVPYHSMAKKRKVPSIVKFQPDDREKKIIEACREKHGLKTAQDILSLALAHYARVEQIAS